MKKIKTYSVTLIIFGVCSLHSLQAMNRRKFMEQPPRLKGIQYRWCQPLNERQIKQRNKMGMTFDREVGKEEGKFRYNYRVGKWVFWDKGGKKMAEGRCEANPPKRETKEHGVWKYWDEAGRKVQMNWVYGVYDGLWTLYEPKGRKVWEYKIHEGEPKVEKFSDEAYLKAENLRKNIPPRGAGAED